MKAAVAATAESEIAHAPTTRASARCRMMSMPVTTNSVAGANTETVAHSKNKKSPNQDVGRPSGTVNSGHSDMRNTTTLTASACRDFIDSGSPTFCLRFGAGKSFATNFTTFAVVFNDPSSAIRRTRRNDCNRSAMAGLAAAPVSRRSPHVCLTIR